MMVRETMSVIQQAASSQFDESPKRWGTLYDVLQVLPTADTAVIEAAYRALIPGGSHNSSPRPELDFVSRQVQQAYAILGDPRRRKAYDLKLRAQQYTSQATAPQQIRRGTACWRCKAAVEPHVPYCGICHWLVCAACRACGCENPDWRPQSDRSGRFTPVVLGWPLAGLLAIALLVVLATRPAAAPAQIKTAPPAPVATAAIATAVSPPVASAPRDPALDRPIEPTAPPAPAPTEAAVAVAASPTSPPVAISAAPTEAPAVARPAATAEPVESTTVAPTASTSPGADQAESQIVTGGQGARLRADPGLQGQIVAVLADRTRVVSLGQETPQDGQLWRRIRAPDGREGWVADAVLEPVAPASP